MLAEDKADEQAVLLQVECSFFKHAYDVGVKNLPEGMSALQFTPNQLDRLGIGAEIERIPWGTKSFKLPPSKLSAAPTSA